MARENAALRISEAEETPIGYHFECAQCGQEQLTITPMFLFGCPTCGAGGITEGVNYMILADTIYPGWRIEKVEPEERVGDRKAKRV